MNSYLYDLNLPKQPTKADFYVSLSSLSRVSIEPTTKEQQTTNKIIS